VLQKSALALACATALGLFSAAAHALSLGRAVVQSALGEPLRAEVELLDISNEEAASLRARLASPESFAASGMEYSPALNGLQISLQQQDGRYFLRLNNPQSVSEPYVDLILEATWASGRLVRDYTLLFDPPPGGGRTPSSTDPTQASAATPEAAAPAPVFTPPVTTALPTPATPLPEAAPAAEPAAPVTTAAPTETAPSDTTSATATEPAPQAAGKDSTPAAGTAQATTPAASTAPATAKTEPRQAAAARNTRINVKSGDTAGEIAMAQLAQQPAYVQVSLNQMLVAMLRANPHAFVNGNVNRLRSGVVLTLPGAEAAQNVSRAQSRQLVIAQNLDFDEYRRRLADAAPTRAAAAQRQSGGSVQPQVQDRRAAPATPDQLTLSKGAVQAQSAQALAEERKAREAAERSAALNKNIAELEQLSKATAPTPPGSGPTAKPGATPAPADSAAGSVPVTSATGAAAQDAAAATPDDSLSFDELVNNLLANPVVPAVGAGLAALLIGLLVYRRRKQRPALDEYQDSMQANELSADAQGAPSVPAGDDVDPVAEAELYLSYGRDQQAEDILKDALPRQPRRVAIHQKLAEIYAKRGDLANFALIATQAYEASGGSGPEWDVISALGRELDPDNSIYQSGDTLGNVSPEADLDFGDPAPAPATAAAPAPRPESPPVDFDLSSLSLDLDAPSPSLSTAPTPAENEDDPLATKLALADEFKAIGDTDGARALIEEIIAEADGEMKSRAEQALAALG
jgi:pilus assembly protein FimV